MEMNKKSISGLNYSINFVGFVGAPLPMTVVVVLLLCRVLPQWFGARTTARHA